MKYWNKGRVRRTRERNARAEMRARERAEEICELERSHTPGNAKKNARLMLDALGDERNRKMLARLRRGGAMSVSKLAKPFGITLSAALQRVQDLERAGLITTHKRGRIRFCAYNPLAVKELSSWLALPSPFEM
ncbi:MAG: helix-turn-helix domain-containing protein [bacterium]|nr:helix-turn-helix domain-containing protein [bacterium]